MVSLPCDVGGHAAFVRTVFDLFPVAGPFFTPGKRSGAMLAGLTGQVGFFAAAHGRIVMHQNSKDCWSEGMAGVPLCEGFDRGPADMLCIVSDAAVPT